MVGSVAVEPAAVLAAHGAGSFPAIFNGWCEHFRVPFVAVDLHAGLDVARAGMEDYAGRIVRAADAARGPVALVGWSMGGLAVMLAARWLAELGQTPVGLVLIEASAPGEVAGFRPEVTLSDGTFDPEQTYGTFPRGQAARTESARARAERKRGVSISFLPCPALVISGREFSEERGRALASRYGASHRSFPLDHWSLVRDPRVAATAAVFLRAARLTKGAEPEL